MRFCHTLVFYQWFIGFTNGLHVVQEVTLQSCKVWEDDVAIRHLLRLYKNKGRGIYQLQTTCPRRFKTFCTNLPVDIEVVFLSVGPFHSWVWLSEAPWRASSRDCCHPPPQRTLEPDGRAPDGRTTPLGTPWRCSRRWRRRGWGQCPPKWWGVCTEVTEGPLLWRWRLAHRVWRWCAALTRRASSTLVSESRCWCPLCDPDRWQRGEDDFKVWMDEISKSQPEAMRGCDVALKWTKNLMFKL